MYEMNTRSYFILKLTMNILERMKRTKEAEENKKKIIMQTVSH